MPVFPGRRSPVWLVVAASVLIGIAWMTLVPPFEGPDESAFYKDLIAVSRGTPAPRSLYSYLMKPALQLAGGQDRPFQARYNPSFRFISNARGRVNMFMHGPLDGFVHADVNRVYLLRLLTVLLWSITAALIFQSARVFFGRDDFAVLTATLVIALPGVSFFASKVHPEATTVLLGAAAYCLIARRVFQRIGRVALWVGAFGLMVLTPASDRQAYFLVLWLPFALVAVETTWRARACGAAVLAVPAAMGAAFVARRGLPGELATFLAPLMPSYRMGWWNIDTLPFLAFEFLPKQAFGFVGWLGQPSILLPAPLYAALLVAIALGLWGLASITPGVPLTREQRRFAWIGAAGVVLTMAPILYTNVLIARTTTGRWLYPSVTPIMIAAVAGWCRVLELAHRRPRALAVGLGATAAGLAALWATLPGDALRAGIGANHYGDADHLIRTTTYAIAMLALVAIAVEASRVVRWPRPLAADRDWPVRLAASAWVLNLVLLVVFVQPLYQPLGADDLTTAVKAEIAEQDFARASALYRIGVAAYPESAALRRIETDEPMLVLSGADELQLARLRERIGRGERLKTRAELLALARLVATKGWRPRDMLEQVVSHAGREPQLSEPVALIRAETSGGGSAPGAAATIVRAGGGQPMQLDLHGNAVLEGYTVTAGAGGRPDVTVYFTPQRDWTTRHLWVHAYPEGSADYLVIDAVPPVFQAWQPGAIAWETFPLPSTDRFTLYVGVEIAGNLGAAFPLGTIGSAHR